MDQGWATVLAASLAAFLALAGLISNILLDARRRAQIRQLENERREADQLRDTTVWLREELHRNAVAFLDALFQIAQLSSYVLDFRKTNVATSKRELLIDLIAAHENLKTAQTVLRLLAPADLVQVIEDSHEAHDALFNLATKRQRQAPSRSDWEALRDAARESREKFISQVRAPLGLGVYDHKIRTYGNP